MNRPVQNEGLWLYRLVERLFPINRSITGHGVRTTFGILSEHIPICLHEVPTGTRAFDWIVPDEWNIEDAFIVAPDGSKIAEFKKNNLHVVGYSIPVDQTLSLRELQSHLHSLPDQPNAVPYVTSYYRRTWGFCLRHRDRERLEQGQYHVVIRSRLESGNLTYGELLLPGERDEEVFLSTYICHPSMANNELSGPAVVTLLAKWLAERPRRYSYRIVFVPETIGALVYLSRHLSQLKERVIAGFNVTCVGDEREVSFLPSRCGRTIADRVARNVLRYRHPEARHYTYLDRGSDERQYCSPGVDLPVASIMRSKYREYPEYHTSLDNLNFISPEGLAESFRIYRDCINAIEGNETYVATTLGEPFLSRYDLYEGGTRSSFEEAEHILNLIAYADGTHDLIEISDIIGVPMSKLSNLAKTMVDFRLLQPIGHAHRCDIPKPGLSSEGGEGGE